VPFCKAVLTLLQKKGFGLESTMVAATANNPRPDDLIEQQGKVRIYIDPQSVPLLQGVVVDFLEGLMESGFKFSNPNATDTCGCGKSFQAGDCTPAAVPCS
jgi:iron-sulfur cluster assembly protein